MMCQNLGARARHTVSAQSLGRQVALMGQERVETKAGEQWGAPVSTRLKSAPHPVPEHSVLVSRGSLGPHRSLGVLVEGFTLTANRMLLQVPGKTNMFRKSKVLFSHIKLKAKRVLLPAMGRESEVLSHHSLLSISLRIVEFARGFQNPIPPKFPRPHLKVGTGELTLQAASFLSAKQTGVLCKISFGKRILMLWQRDLPFSFTEAENCHCVCPLDLG